MVTRWHLYRKCLSFLSTVQLPIPEELRPLMELYNANSVELNFVPDSFLKPLDHGFSSQWMKSSRFGAFTQIPHDDELLVSDSHFRIGLAAKLDMVKPAHMPCFSAARGGVVGSQISTGYEFVRHVYCCPTCSQFFWNMRHDRINTNIAWAFRESGIIYKIEPPRSLGFYKDIKPGMETSTMNFSHRGPDGLFLDRHLGTVIVDISVGYQNEKNVDRLCQLRSAKIKSYENFCNLNPTICFQPIIASSDGVICAKDVLWLRRWISKEVMCQLKRRLLACSAVVTASMFESAFARSFSATPT